MINAHWLMFPKTCNVNATKDKTIIVVYVSKGAHPWDANQESKM